MARIVVLLADGTEEMEFVITVDILRRAQWNVVAAGIESEAVIASRKVRITADTTLARVRLDEFDGIVVPGGGPGVQAMCGSPRVLDAVRYFDRAGKLVAAICAGPLVLSSAGVLRGKSYTCYPGVEKQIAGAAHRNQKVVKDGHVLTSQGPGTAFAFALAIVAHFDGVAKAQEVARAALVSSEFAD
jgi:4-methyl-5(b-hydroxyethyl)-thiazole monophosphate biosynthesis